MSIDISDPAVRERFIIELGKLRAKRLKKPVGVVCWCSSPLDGEPLCPCKMRAMREDFDDAIRAMNEVQP